MRNGERLDSLVRMRDFALPYADKLNAVVTVTTSRYAKGEYEIRLELRAFDHVGVVVWREGMQVAALQQQLAGLVESITEAILRGRSPFRDGYPAMTRHAGRPSLAGRGTSA